VGAILGGRHKIWHKSLPREPPPSDAHCPGPPTSQGLPHTPTGTAVERPPSSRSHASLYVSRIPPGQRMAFGSSYPFTTKPCGLGNVLQRFQAPVLGPQQQPPMAERSRGDKAAYGEQIQQNVTGSSRAQVGPKPGLLHIRYGGLVPENLAYFHWDATHRGT